MKKLFVMFLFAGAMATVVTSCGKDTPAPQNQTGDPDTEVPVSDGIKGDLSAITLEEGKTYKVIGDLTIPEGKSVTVPAGVTFEFQEGSNGEAWFVDVHGSLYVNGTEAKRVSFKPSAALINSSKNQGIGQLWGGIVGTITTGDLVLQYTDISHAGGAVRSTNAFAAEATDKELEAGDAAYALFFIRQDGKRQDGIFVLRHSKIEFTPDDAIRINGGKTLMHHNVFQVTGGTGGDAVNIKAGAHGDFAFNLFYNLATNGLKSADTGPGTRGKLESNFYNNTILNSGYRRAEAGRGAGLNYESKSYGKCYNNLLVNNRFGLRLVTGETAPDVSKLEFGYNWYYGSVQTIVDQFYPNLGSSIGLIGTNVAGSLPKPASDKVGTAKANDPMFENYDPSTFVYSGNTSDAKTKDITPMPTDADFHLKTNSPALTGGKTDFGPVHAEYKTLDGKMTFTAPQPAVHFGALGRK